MKTGTFVCSCADTCDIDLETAREGVTAVDVAASSRMLCGDGRNAMEAVIDEHDLDQLIISCPEAGVQDDLRDIATEHGLHPDAVEFVDQREGAGWVHEESAATDKTARLLNAAYAGLEHESVSRNHSAEAGDSVAVVGDAESAVALADRADVTLIADGTELAGEADLDEVTVERGRVADVDGRFGEFTLTLESRVTEDCISCMECVRRGPDGMVTSRPIDIDPEAPDGGWADCCPTDAIEMDGHERERTFDQVIYPAADEGVRGGRIGFYTGTVDAATVAAVESLIGGYDGPDFLDLEMDICAAGESSQQGCTACVDACPHDAVARPRIDDVEFHKEACQNCGACTSSCPTGAVKLREPSNERIAREVEALLSPTTDDSGGWLFDRGSSGIETPVLAFVCSERAAEAISEYGRRAAMGTDIEYPPVLPVSVNCTDTVGEAHVMHALAAGADGVAIVGCGDSCLHSGPDPKAELVERLNRATADLGLGERVGFFAPDIADYEPFVEELRSFAEGLTESPIPPGDHEATGRIDGGAERAMTDGGATTQPSGGVRPNPDFDSHGWTLESIRAILAHTEAERDVIRGLKNFADVEVSDTCTLTPTCSNLCPTDALRRSGPELEFSHERCVNCGLCEEGCMEDAIELEPGLHLDLLPERRGGDAWKTAFEGEMRECSNCGTAFTSEGSATKIEAQVGGVVEGLAPDGENVFEYCSDCRAKLLYKQETGDDA
ncbi:MAG: ferredoxin [Natronomonas sp.]|jgi:ferredoxin|uniref:hydrogenase iron-sulfur subunit n=1 Tax=Natronomonas sp. TaxID=2184060 RepID=UPI0039E502EA